MTREEKQKAIDAVERLHVLKLFIGYDKDSDIVKATQKSLDMAIKALESNDVLDKIRAEIVQMPTISFNANDIYKADVLSIIDKYKAESEDNA